MKNANLTITKIAKGIAMGFLGAALLAMTVGCSDSKKGGGAAPGRYGAGYYNRYGQPGYNGYGVVSSVTAGIETQGRAMVILATSTQPGTGGAYGGGEAFVEGELDVFTPMGCIANPALGLSPGVYQLVPAGGMSFLDVDWLQNVVLEARGPYGIAIVTIPFAKFFMTNVCGFNGMQGQLNIESINGYQCGIFTGFSDYAAGGQCGY